MKNNSLTVNGMVELLIIGNNLKRIMERKLVNRIKLHRKTGISPKTVNKIINAECNPNILTLTSITKYLEVDMNTLLEDNYALSNVKVS